MNGVEMRQQLSLMEISGVCSLMVKGEAIISEAFGCADRSRGIRNTVETRFGTASIAKGFTAVALLQLVERGVLALTSRVTAILPGYFPKMDSDVTVLHLLTHTSGFEDYCDEEQDTAYDASWNRVLTEPKAYLPLLAEKGMESVPGTKFKYNNGGFAILSLIIEAVCGSGFHDYVREHVLKPAGMNESGYYRLDSLPPNTAIGYTADERGQAITNLGLVPIIGGGDGGIYTTVADLDRFWRALSQGILLSPATVQAAWTPQVYSGNGQLHYGLGFWVVAAGDIAGHVFLMGGDRGVSCRSVYYPERQATIGVLLNHEASARPAYKLLEECLLNS